MKHDDKAKGTPTSALCFKQRVSVKELVSTLSCLPRFTNQSIRSLDVGMIE